MKHQLSSSTTFHSHSNNSIHKLIHLDSNPYSHASIPNEEALTSCPDFPYESANDRETQDLQVLWKHIDSLYFKRLTDNDSDHIVALISQLDQTPSVGEGLSTAQELSSLWGKEAEEADLKDISRLADDMLLIKKENNRSNSDELAQELQKTINNQHIVHIQNVQKLLELKDKVLRTTPETTSGNISLVKGNRELLEENGLVTGQGQLKQTQIDHLKNMILRLEDQQAAESIKFIVDCRKNEENPDYEFCIIFDEAIADSDVWVQEQTLDKFDSMREQSVFKISNIPQKTVHSLTTYNTAALNVCNQKMIHRALEIKEKPWKQVMKSTLGERSNDLFATHYRGYMYSKTKNMGLCHHCRYLFPQDLLFTCKYKSSVTGVFPVDCPYELLGRISEEQGSKNISCLYKWKEEEDEYVCDRKFCRSCLKNNYDLNPDDISTQKHWLCPFCKGHCYCSRCLRHDHINKLIRLYLSMGGDLETIVNESSLRKYIWRSINKTIKAPSKQTKTENPSGPEVKKRRGRKPNASKDPSLHKKVKLDETTKPQSQTQGKRGRPRKDRSILPGFEFCHSQEETIPGSKKQFYKTTHASSIKHDLELALDQLEKKQESLYQGDFSPLSFSFLQGTQVTLDDDVEQIFLEDDVQLEDEEPKAKKCVEIPLYDRIKVKAEAVKPKKRGRPKKHEKIFVGNEDSQNLLFVGHWSK